MSAKKRSARRILLFIAEDWYFWSHRLPIARAAMQAGYAVTLVTRVNRFGDRIRAEGLRLLPLSLDRGGSNPWREWNTFRELVHIYRNEQPDLVHHVALKPIIYGSLAAWLAGIRRVVNALAGLGYVFSSEQWKARFLRPMVRAAYRLILNGRDSRTIVQNPDDLSLLTTQGILKSGNGVLIRGSGVDTDLFRPTPEPSGVPLVVLVARLIRDKGVCEFVEAARVLRRSNVQARFVLVGDRDPANPTAVSAEELADWQRSGIVEWWGHRDDVREVFERAHIVCLPSYREGLPKVLLEAAASGRPIVATDVPGCREVVRDWENGLLIPSRNAEALAQALRRLIDDPALRRLFGARAREIAVEEFSVEKVVNETLSLYRELLAQ